MVWGRHWKPHHYPNNSEDFQERVLADTWCDYNFFILFKENRPSSVLQAKLHQQPCPCCSVRTFHWQHQPLPPCSGLNGWNLFFDEQVLSFRLNWNTQQDGASTKSFSEPSLWRSRVIGNNNTGSFKSWRNCCQETFAGGQPWKQTTQLPRTLFRSLRCNCVNIF